MWQVIFNLTLLLLAVSVVSVFGEPVENDDASRKKDKAKISILADNRPTRVNSVRPVIAVIKPSNSNRYPNEDRNEHPVGDRNRYPGPNPNRDRDRHPSRPIGGDHNHGGYYPPEHRPESHEEHGGRYPSRHDYVTFYQKPYFRGWRFNARLGRRCRNLENEYRDYDNAISSVRTNGNCVVVYPRYDCRGRGYTIRPRNDDNYGGGRCSTSDHSELGADLDNRISSYQRC